MATWQYNDGGRLDAGYKGSAGDCVVRSVAIATGRKYADVYEDMAREMKRHNEYLGARVTRGARHNTPRDGVNVRQPWFGRYMQSLGFVWVPTMFVGVGCKTHLRADELPSGVLVVAVSKHYTAVIDGVIHDTFDPSRGGLRCVYGYWRKIGGAL